MGKTANEAVAEAREFIREAGAVVRAFPDARRERIPNGSHVWVADVPAARVMGVEVVLPTLDPGGLLSTAYAAPYALVSVDSGAVRVLHASIGRYPIRLDVFMDIVAGSIPAEEFTAIIARALKP